MGIPFYFKLDFKYISRPSVFSIRDNALFLMEIVNRIQNCLAVETDGNVLIRIEDKVSRIFFFEENRMSSIYFPFSIQKLPYYDESQKIFQYNYAFFFKSNQVTSIVISDVLSLLNDEKLRNLSENAIDDLVYKIDDFFLDDDGMHVDVDREQIAWNIYSHMMTCEPGYLRYDYDEENKEKPNHPLNHLDINFSKKSTYKIGLPDKPRPTKDWFVEMCLSNPVKSFKSL